MNKKGIIVYKYVVKRLGQYYPLINFGIDGKVKNCPRYKLDQTYSNPKNFDTIRPYTKHYTMLDHYIGYHFFKYPKPKGYNSLNLSRKKGNVYNDWTNYLKRRLKKDIKITILKCCVYKSYIKAQNETRIVAKKFKVLGEVK